MMGNSLDYCVNGEKKKSKETSCLNSLFSVHFRLIDVPQILDGSSPLIEVGQLVCVSPVGAILIPSTSPTARNVAM